MPKLHFVFFDAGGGHRSAATALESVIAQQGRPWDIQLVNLQEVLEPLDIFRRYFRIRMEDIYNSLLQRGWTYRSELLIPAMHAIIRLYHGPQRRMLAEYWRREQPDLVVSFIPNFARALYEGLRDANPATPLLTVITDFADYPPHFWMEPGLDQHIVCGTHKAEEQARAMRYPREKIHRVSGMILRPTFYDAPPVDQAAERARLGLEPGVPTGLLMFGGQGSSAMVDIVERLDACRRPLQLIAICGRNEKLAARLRELRVRTRRHIVGFTRDVPHFMALSDFFIGKPGPGSISEALAMHLPVVVESNTWTLPQERYNAEWVRDTGVGVVLPNFRGIAAAVDEMLEPSVLAGYRDRAVAVQNRAVFEIVEILDRILSRQP